MTQILNNSAAPIFNMCKSNKIAAKKQNKMKSPKVTKIKSYNVLGEK